MSLAVPGRVLTVEGADPAFRTGRVDFRGVHETVNLAFTPNVRPGDFVLVHVGFAIWSINEDEAARTFQHPAQIGATANKGIAMAAGGSGPS